jgi:hypothetical protein
MTPWTILTAVLLWAASLAATGAWFYGAGQDSELATQAKVDKARQETRALAADAAASAIAQIEVKTVTIRQQLQREVQTREIYRDCVAGPDARRLLNSSPGIAQPGPGSAGGGELPAAGPAR